MASDDSVLVVTPAELAVLNKFRMSVASLAKVAGDALGTRHRILSQAEIRDLLRKPPRDSERKSNAEAHEGEPHATASLSLECDMVRKFAMKLIRGDGYSKRLLLEWKHSTRRQKEDEHEIQ